jgi:hypothetical protein
VDLESELVQNARTMTQLTRYFIVVGRLHGDHEATALILDAVTREDAVQQFCDGLRTWTGEANQPMPEDGPGHVYIDSVFDCGDRRPDEV